MQATKITLPGNVFSAGAGVKYLLNRNLYLGGAYSYQQRNSIGTAAGRSYAQSIFDTAGQHAALN